MNALNALANARRLASAPAKQDQMSRIIRDSTLVVFDPYVPLPIKWTFDKTFRGHIKTKLIKWAQSLYCTVDALKHSIRLKKKELPGVADALYIRMNAALASHDSMELEKVTTPSMNRLLTETLLTRYKTLPKMVWKDLGPIVKTRVVHTVMGQIPIDRQNVLKKVQSTLMVFRKQSLTVPGKAPIMQELKEYIVLEKDVTGPNADSEWRIAARIQQ